MRTFTNCVLDNILENGIPYSVVDLLPAYHPGEGEILSESLYAEPYYGDYNNCSVVLLTHNPGSSNVASKGLASVFEHNLMAAIPPLTRADSYHNMAVANVFPNPGTNRWVNDRNVEIQKMFGGRLTKRLFIRDLVPYHSQEFGQFHFNAASTFLHRDFFPQVFNAALNSELHNSFKAKCGNNSPLIILSRGERWKNLKNGLSSIGWSFIGRIYSNLYIYKLDSGKFKKTKGFYEALYGEDILKKDIYIFVITPQKGGRVNIYKNAHRITTVFTLIEVVENYYNIPNHQDVLHIMHDEALNHLMNSLACFFKIDRSV